MFMEASAKTRENVNDVFYELAEKIIENPALFESSQPKETVKTGLISTFAILDYPVWEKFYGSGVWGPLETENYSSKKFKNLEI